MSRRKIVLLAAAITGALIISAWLVLQHSGVPRLGFGTAVSMENSTHVLKCVVTNSAPFGISLTRPAVIREDQAGRLTSRLEVWDNSNGITNLVRNGAAVLSVPLSGDEKRVQFLITYTWEGGAFRSL
jgi:hypothetical protein